MIVLLRKAERKFFIIIQMSRKKGFEQISAHTKDKNLNFLMKIFCSLSLRGKIFCVSPLCVPPNPKSPLVAGFSLGRLHMGGFVPPISEGGDKALMGGGD